MFAIEKPVQKTGFFIYLSLNNSLDNLLKHLDQDSRISKYPAYGLSTVD